MTIQADGNVPQIGPRYYYNLVGMNPSLLEHRGAAMDGTLPATALKTASELDPVVSGGKAVWADLIHGGLFPFTGKSIIVEGLTGSGNIWTIVDSSGNGIRSTPVGFPFKLLPNEYLKAVGGTVAGVIVRLDAQRIL